LSFKRNPANAPSLFEIFSGTRLSVQKDFDIAGYLEDMGAQAPAAGLPTDVRQARPAGPLGPHGPLGPSSEKPDRTMTATHTNLAWARWSSTSAFASMARAAAGCTSGRYIEKKIVA
jgi:hypothetical protein